MKFVYPCLVILLSAWAVAPLAYPGTIQAHSGLAPVYNLMNLNSQLGSSFGWIPTWGDSFDMFRSEGIFPYALGEFFHLFGTDYLTSIKLVYGLSFIVSGLGMFFLVRAILQDVDAATALGAGLLSAVVYIYQPYHLAVVYVRGAFAESVIWAGFPLALMVLIRLDEHFSIHNLVLTFVAFAILFLSGLGLGILLSIFAIVAIAFLRMAVRNFQSVTFIRSTVLPISFALLFTLIFESPALIQNHFAIKTDGFSAIFVYPFQLFTASWGSDIPSGSFLDKFPFQLGVVGIGLALASIFFRIRANSRETLSFRWQNFLLTSCVASLLLVMVPLPSLWHLLGLDILINAPWKLLFIANLTIAIVSGLVVVFEPRLAQIGLLAPFVILPLLTSYQYLAPAFYDFVPSRPPVAVFANEIALLDYKIIRPTGTIFHGATVQVDLHWQALKPVSNDYVVTFQAVDADGKIWGQQDIRPQDGNFPTRQWVPGMIISDTHSLQVDLDGPREGYRLILALYESPGANRAKTETGALEAEIRPNE